MGFPIIGIVVLCIVQLGISLPVVDNDAQSAKPIQSATNTFSADFYKSVAQLNKNTNLVTSPLSAHLVLAMTSFGAEGETKKILRDGLHLTLDDEATATGFSSLMRILNSKESLGVTLKSANKIFTSKNTSPKEKFLEILETSFNSSIQRIDHEDPQRAAEIINNWVEQETNHKIKEIITSDSIPKSKEMVLLNSVYFQGDWTFPFSKENTLNRPFYYDEKTYKSVPTMQMEAALVTGKVPNLPAKFVVLPYGKNKRVTMTLVVPDAIDGLPLIEQNLHLLKKETLYSTAIKFVVKVSLPKFKIESTLDLNETLEKVGLGHIFTKFANFNGMAKESLSINKVSQKAIIEVNETGTEAVAVTSEGLVNRMRKLSVKVNRPSLVIIRVDGIDLFIARLNDPTV